MKTLGELISVNPPMQMKLIMLQVQIFDLHL